MGEEKTWWDDVPFGVICRHCCFCWCTPLPHVDAVPALPPRRHPQLFFLEERRKQCLQDLATLIQKIYRGWKCRTHFLLLRKSQIVVSAWYRRYAVSTRSTETTLRV